jgi:hypothetical protein
MNVPAEQRSRWVLPAYGWYAVALGTADFLHGAIMVFSGSAATETNFVGHLTQAHAGTVIGLGCLALGLRQLRARLRSIHMAILLANLLGAVIYASAARQGHSVVALLVASSQAFWAVCFAMLLLEKSTASPTDLPSPGLFARVMAFSFSILVVMSGLVWVLMPAKFATAAAGSLAGAAAVFAGQTRGATDVGLGLVAWLLVTRREPGVSRAIAAAVLVANLALAVAGLLAQLSVLYTPARWVVEGLHLFWSVGFAWVWLRLRKS